MLLFLEGKYLNKLDPYHAQNITPSIILFPASICTFKEIFIDISKVLLSAKQYISMSSMGLLISTRAYVIGTFIWFENNIALN